MKKLFGKSFLALALAMTMLMGMCMTVMAATYSGTVGLFNQQGGFKLLVDGTKELKTGDILSKGTKIDGVVNVFYDGDLISSTGPTELDKAGEIISMDALHKELRLGTPSAPAETAKKSEPAHTHSYEWTTLLEPTTECDGEEAYVCSCGDVEMKQPLSAALYTLRLNEKAIKNAKAGATVVVDVKRFNSLPKWFVEKVVERDDLEITLKFTYNHENYALNVPKTATIEDESIAWYGPLKLLSMFPQK